MAYFHDVRLSHIEAIGAKTAFEVDAYPDRRLEDFRLDHLQIEANTAGHISDAVNWTFSNISLRTADGSVVALSDDSNVKGIGTTPSAVQQSKAKLPGNGLSE